MTLAIHGVSERSPLLAAPLPDGCKALTDPDEELVLFEFPSPLPNDNSIVGLVSFELAPDTKCCDNLFLAFGAAGFIHDLYQLVTMPVQLRLKVQPMCLVGPNTFFHGKWSEVMLVDPNTGIDGLFAADMTELFPDGVPCDCCIELTMEYRVLLPDGSWTPAATVVSPTDGPATYSFCCQDVPCN